MSYYHREAAPAGHRPNPLLLISGLVLILAGTGIMLIGLLTALRTFTQAGLHQGDLGSGPHARHDLEPLVDGFTALVIGCTIMTAGRYLWRGARRRGWRDRLGRLMVIFGYADVAVALYVLSRFILRALDQGGQETSGQTVIHGLIACALVALPGVVLALPGLRMAKEDPLMKASVKAKL
ncbi:hypothetical protein [Actinomadura gamaensis]|uniref:DUF2637 domain-containing protein n=1 Tax=Actinomadura gamaensis TaxID=1763541 RepID=A0ABV9U3F3_9ACTN